MKELKIMALVMTLCFVTSLTATTKMNNPFYPDSVKGGLQTSKDQDSCKLAVTRKEGKDQKAVKKIKSVQFFSRCNKK